MARDGKVDVYSFLQSNTVHKEDIIERKHRARSASKRDI